MDLTLTKLLERFWDWTLQKAPEFASSIGNRERERANWMTTDLEHIQRHW